MTYIYIPIPPAALELLVTHQSWATVSRSNPKYHGETGDVYIYILCDKTSTCVKNQFSVCMCVCVATQSAWAPDLKPRRCQRHAHLVTSRLRRQTSQRGTNSPGVTAPGVSSQRVRLKGRGKAGVSPVWRKPCDVFFFYFTLLHDKAGIYRSRRGSFYLYNADVYHRWKV